jgi:hypothetical protein
MLQDYYPAVESPDIRQWIMEHLYETLSADLYCLDVRQFLNEIIITLDGSHQESFGSLHQLIRSMQSVTSLCNQKAEQFHWTHHISFVMAADAGMSAKLELLNRNKLPAVSNWSGLHVDRASNLTNVMIQGGYPQILVTHAFYRHLSEEEQQKYKRLYYILHICCYAEGKEFGQEMNCLEIPNSSKG